MLRVGFSFGAPIAVGGQWWECPLLFELFTVQDPIPKKARIQNRPMQAAEEGGGARLLCSYYNERPLPKLSEAIMQ